MAIVDFWRGYWRITPTTPKGHRGKRAKRAAFAVNSKRFRSAKRDMKALREAAAAIAKQRGSGE